MPRVKLTKNAIDALPTPSKDIVYWDRGCPGFGVKITPKGRRVFIVPYRAGGAGSRLRKYTIGPYGRVTLHQARAAALRIFAARTDGRDPAAEKQLERRRLVVDGVEDLVELFISEHVSKIGPPAKSPDCCDVRWFRAGERAAFTRLASAKSSRWWAKCLDAAPLPPRTSFSKR